MSDRYRKTSYVILRMQVSHLSASKVNFGTDTRFSLKVPNFEGREKRLSLVRELIRRMPRSKKRYPRSAYNKQRSAPIKSNSIAFNPAITEKKHSHSKQWDCFEFRNCRKCQFHYSITLRSYHNPP